MYDIKVEWKGPFDLQAVTEKKNDGGASPNYEGIDYGLYQIYGTHILFGPDKLLYVGKTVENTFSDRFKEHKEWLLNERDIKIYLGRIYDSQRHSKKDNWRLWKEDVEIAEKIIIYKYSPPYNSSNISEQPSLRYRVVRIAHDGRKGELMQEDVAPQDWKVTARGI